MLYVKLIIPGSLIELLRVAFLNARVSVVLPIGCSTVGCDVTSITMNVDQNPEKPLPVAEPGCNT